MNEELRKTSKTNEKELLLGIVHDTCRDLIRLSAPSATNRLVTSSRNSFTLFSFSIAVNSYASEIFFRNLHACIQFAFSVPPNLKPVCAKLVTGFGQAHATKYDSVRSEVAPLWQIFHAKQEEP